MRLDPSGMSPLKTVYISVLVLALSSLLFALCDAFLIIGYCAVIIGSGFIINNHLN